MRTHRIINADSMSMDFIKNETIDLIVTSPPYPMIQMWDRIFLKSDLSIKDDFTSNNIQEAFNKMHGILAKTWMKCNRVLKVDGVICINIGDATRTVASVRVKEAIGVIRSTNAEN